VTLKRTLSGYSWTVSVAAASDELEAMRKAVEAARQVDADLTAIYGPPREPRRQRVHIPANDAADEAAERSKR
jgi:hypothetical protein